MSSHLAIVDALTRAAAADKAIVLATVVRVIGSSYGGVGARMLIRVDGSTVGLVSGGCLESDLCAHAIDVHSTGRSRVVTYDTRADDEAVWGLGLGCSGLIDVLLQPLSPADAQAAGELLRAALIADEPSVIATVVESESGDPALGAQALLGLATTSTFGDWGSGAALQLSSAHVTDALAAGRRGLVRELDGAIIAFEMISPAVRLVVCGAGPDAAPLCRSGRDLGWDVILVDHRPITEAHTKRFPGARAIECLEPEALASHVSIGRRTAAVVMSHHFARDTGYVQALLAAGARYVGVLGPRPRTERMLAEIATRGAGSAACGGELYGPVGLDLGGEGPQAIALAIVAEISAVMNERSPGHLRDSDGPLHGQRPLRAASHAQ